MRRLPFLAVALFLWFAPAALAQPEVVSSFIACGPRDNPVVSTPGQMRARRIFMARDEVAAFLRTSAPAIVISSIRQTAKATPTLEFVVSRPPAIPVVEWRRAWIEAVIYPANAARTQLSVDSLVAGQVQPPSPGDGNTAVTVEFPGVSQGWWPAAWEVALFVCVDAGIGANPDLDDYRLVRGYARTSMFVSSLKLSTAIGIGAFLALYIVLALTAAQLHRRQYEVALVGAERASGRVIPLWSYALRPTVIAQDAFGYCSLARFQVLMFTLVLTGVYAYVWARTGTLSGLSDTVLALLGITLTGSTLARVLEGPTVDTPNRVWLLGTGVVDPSPRIPRWQDMLAGEGEVDVTRVQALGFSIFAAAALVVSGTGDLQNFEVPKELNYLIGLSQAVYVAGRALPRESAKRLNEEVRAARDAEAQAMAHPEDSTARLAFETARNALSSTLFDFFGERFRSDRLMELIPGRRVPPEPVYDGAAPRS